MGSDCNWRMICPPWRDAVCLDCEKRGLPSFFYLHFWGTGHDHVCPPLTREEIQRIVDERVSAALVSSGVLALMEGTDAE